MSRGRFLSSLFQNHEDEFTHAELKTLYSILKEQKKEGGGDFEMDFFKDKRKLTRLEEEAQKKQKSRNANIADIQPAAPPVPAQPIFAPTPATSRKVTFFPEDKTYIDPQSRHVMDAKSGADITAMRWQAKYGDQYRFRLGFYPVPHADTPTEPVQAAMAKPKQRRG